MIKEQVLVRMPLGIQDNIPLNLLGHYQLIIIMMRSTIESPYDMTWLFPFTIVVNSIIWYGISYIINKYYWKNILFNMRYQKLIRGRGTLVNRSLIVCYYSQ
jgi:hypothetical protein